MAGTDSIGQPLPDRTPIGLLREQAEYATARAARLDETAAELRATADEHERDAAKYRAEAAALVEAAAWLAPPVVVRADPARAGDLAAAFAAAAGAGRMHFPGPIDSSTFRAGVIRIDPLTRPTGRSSGHLEYDGVPVSTFVDGQPAYVRVPARLADKPATVERIARAAQAFHDAPEDSPQPEYSEAQQQGARGRRPKRVDNRSTCPTGHAGSVVDVECRSGGEAVHCVDCGTTWPTVMSWDRGAPGFPLPKPYGAQEQPAQARSLLLRDYTYPGQPRATALTCEPEEIGQRTHVFPDDPSEDDLRTALDKHVKHCPPCQSAGVGVAAPVTVFDRRTA